MTEYNLPRKTVDSDESVEERLTDNVANNILPARYLLKDDDGNIDETPKEMFRRVANGVAEAELEFDMDYESYEKWGKEFQTQMEELRLMPNSPTLFNYGTDNQQGSACIAGESPVYTKQGLKRMDEVSEGDEVLTHKGRFKEVTAHWSNGEKETIEMKRGWESKHGYDARMTPDHTVLTEDGSWVDAEETDSIAAPEFPEAEFPETIDLSRYENVTDKNVVADGGRVKVKNSDDPRTAEFSKNHNQPLVSVENNDDFAYIIGAYLAEGDIDGNDVRFTIGSHEDEFETEITTRLSELFDIPVSVSESNHGNWKTISISSAFVSELFLDVIGTGSSKKRIPHFVGGGTDSYKKELLRGLYDGDGHETDTQKKLALVNPTLAYQAALLTRSVGGDCRFQLDANRELSANDTSLVITTNQKQFDKIDKRGAGTTEVYDMEVEDDHSFVVGDFVVHNCFVINPDDTLEDIKETEKEAALVFKSGGGMGYSFSNLRPNGALISSTGGGSSGPVSFMKMFNENCQQVAQGGCVDASARVMTDSGYVKLSEVHDGPPLRQSPNGDARVYTRGGDLDAVVESSDSGTMQTVAIKTESGFDIEVTPNHEILTLGDDGLEFTEARNIDSSSTIILSGADKRTDVRHELAEPPEAHYNSNEPDTYPDFVTDQFAKFVGLLKGDGTVDIDNDRVIITLGNNGNGDSAAADFFESYCSELGISYTENDRSGSGKGDYTDYRINSAPFVEWLQSCGIGNTRTVPEVIYRSPASFESFLAGLTVDGSYVNDANTFKYSTAHESFASEIQDILLACGIHSKITSIDSSNYSARYSDKPQYTVRVSPGSSAHDFEENVNEFLDGFELGRGGERQNKFESPSFVEKVLAEHYTKGHELPETVDRRSMKELRRFSRGDRTPSLQRLRSLLEDVDINPDGYDALDTENVFEDVSSVTESESVVCDIENKTGYPEYVASNVVVHNKRRGAQMGIMDVRHPDIARFCVAKRKEGNLDNFNISIGVRDEFENAVRDDEMYTLYDPQTDFDEPFDLIEVTKQFYSPEYEDSPEAVVGENLWRDYVDSIEAWDWEQEKTVSFRGKWADDERLSFETGEPMELPARFIWDIVIDGGWRNGEPGVVHLDEMNREHSYDMDKHPNKEIICTNPCCVTGDTRISTNEGLKQVADLYRDEGPEKVSVDERLSDDVSKDSTNVYVTGQNADVYELSTKEGYSVKVTADHEIRTDGGWVEAQDLDEGDEIHVQSRMGEFGDEGTPELGRVLGWLVGDGHLKFGEERAVLNFYGEDTRFSSQFESDVNEIVRAANGNANYEISANEVTRKDGQGSSVTEERIRSTRLFEVAKENGLTEKKLQVPETIFESNRPTAASFLNALFSADGSVQGSEEKGYSIRLGTTSLELAHDVQELLSNFGIYSTVYEERREAGLSEMPDGQGGTKSYETKALHEVAITSVDMVKFNEEIGFVHQDKQQKLDEVIDSYDRGPYSHDYTATVESFDYVGEETVYDLTEDETHSFIANGLVVHNSEQPLEEYESCTLAHVNLSLLVEQDAPTFDEYDGSVEDYFYEAVDFSNFDRTIEAGVRMLDNIVEANEFPIDELREMADKQRKIGLGLMGFAQMLYQMDIEYGSEESYEMARCVMRHIQQTAAQYSHSLAKERGSFENWDKSKYANPQEHAEWFERFTGLPADDYSDGFEMRNHNVTTIAPTGTTSMIADTSGGCEPVYNVMYYKNVGNDIQGAEKLVEIDDFFRRTLEANDIDVDEVRKEALSYMEPDDKSFEGVHQLDTVPDDISDLFVTVNDLTPRQHGIIQRVFQKYNQSGISKTVNLPHDANRADVHDAYLLSIADPSDEPGHRAKGVSLYRDESRNEQVLSTNATTKNAKGEEIMAKAEELNGELEDAAEMLDRQHYDDVADLLREVNVDA
jgi:ribonucleotide reductase alpha subunit